MLGAEGAKRVRRRNLLARGSAASCTVGCLQRLFILTLLGWSVPARARRASLSPRRALSPRCATPIRPARSARRQPRGRNPATPSWPSVLLPPRYNWFSRLRERPAGEFKCGHDRAIERRHFPGPPLDRTGTTQPHCFVARRMRPKTRRFERQSGERKTDRTSRIAPGSRCELCGCDARRPYP